MRKYFYTIIALAFFSCSIAFAQEKNNIVDDLNTPKWGQGKVTVYQDDVVQAVLDAQKSDTTSYNTTAGNVVKIKGFRIAVFSDNRANAKREAESIRNQIKSVYPDIDAVISYQSPRWRLRVGNYATAEEAESALAEMKKTLSRSLTREMKVIQDVVVRSAAE